MKCDFDYCKYFKEKQCMSNNDVYSSCKYRHYYYFFKSIDEVLNMNEDITKFILDFIIKENILNGDDLYKKI